MRSLSLRRDDEVLFPHVELAETMGERMKGLLGRDLLPEGHAMWLAPCASVHTFFMRFSIDLIFLDRDLKVIDIRRDVLPGRMVFGARGSYSVLELSAGWSGLDSIRTGDILSQ